MVGRLPSSLTPKDEPDDHQRKMLQIEQKLLEQRLRQQLRESEEDSKWLLEEESNFRKRLSCSDRSGCSDTDSVEGGLGSPMHSGGDSSSSSASRELTDSEIVSMKPPLSNVNGTLGKAAALPFSQHAANFSYQQQSTPKSLESAPTADIDRTNDQVYECTTLVVKSVMILSQGVQQSHVDEYLDLVKKVGLELRSLLGSVDILISELPPETHREIEMAHKVLSKDMAELVSSMKQAQRYSSTTLDAEYRRGMLSAAHVLAMDAKNLLDVVDTVRIRLHRDLHGNLAHGMSPVHVPEHK